VLSCFPAVYRWCRWVGTVQLNQQNTEVYTAVLLNIHASWHMAPCRWEVTDDVKNRGAFLFRVKQKTFHRLALTRKAL